MDLGLTQRSYILTGATSGLGLATAAALVADGANVVISSRSQTHVDQALAVLGPQAAGVVLDNADPEASERLIGLAIERFGRLDGALISVGGPPATSVMATSEADWQAAFDAVFLGTIRLATSIAARLESGGSLALVLSTSVKAPLAGLAISNGLRPGLAMVAKTLADELGPQGIRVNGLLPGRINTARTQALDQQSSDPAAARMANTAGVPLRRYGEPEEFGKVAAFVLSPAASYLTGTMIPIDGGITRSL